MRESNRLTALKVSKARAPGRYGDGGGLYLQVSRSQTKSWVFRFMRNGRIREMGLGPVDIVSLADAREKAREARRLILDGSDPIEARREARLKALADEAKTTTFQECSEGYIKAHRAGWKNAKHIWQWETSLSKFVFPVFGRLAVNDVNTGLVIKALEPIWTTKTETATRVRQRIEAVLDWAKVRGYRKGENPARWRGHLEKLLPAPSKVAPVVHLAAMPYGEMPAFFSELRKRDVTSAKALAFTILTAARSGEVRLATLGEIDFKEAVWIVPGRRTKSARAHRVPLTTEALSLLPAGGEPTALLFPSARSGALSDATMRKYLQEDMGHPDLTVHGFRSSFKDWARERTNFASEVSEAALAHIIGDKTEAAYARGDLFDKRRRLMDAWAKYCTSGAASDASVVPLRGRGEVEALPRPASSARARPS
jgi:integrase